MDKLKPQDIEKLKIGFCLELHFRQDSISNELNSLADFIKTNENLFSVIDIPCFYQSIQNLNHFFLIYTDTLINDVDKNEKYCSFHKDFL